MLAGGEAAGLLRSLTPAGQEAGQDAGARRGRGHGRFAASLELETLRGRSVLCGEPTLAAARSALRACGLAASPRRVGILS